MSKAFEALLANLREHPETWKQGAYTLESDRISIWVGNGPLFYGWDGPVRGGFSLINKARFFFAFKAWRDVAMQRLLFPTPKPTNPEEGD